MAGNTYVIMPAGRLEGTFHEGGYSEACRIAEKLAKKHKRAFRVYNLHNSVYLARNCHGGSGWKS